MHGTLHKINSVQLGAASTMPPSYIRVRAVVWAYGRGQTDTQTRMTTIHFVPSTTHAKCNQQHAHTPRKLRFALCCHSNATRAAIVNPPNSAQLGGSLHHAPKLHPGPCSSVGVRPRTDRQTGTQTRVTTIHFASSTTHAKCNNNKQLRCFCSRFCRHHCTCFCIVKSATIIDMRIFLNHLYSRYWT